MSVGPLSIKTKHLSLVLSKHRKYRAVSQLSLPVPFCLAHWTMLYRFTDYPSRDHNVKRWMVMLTWLCRFHVRNFRIWKELKKKIEKSSVNAIIGEGIWNKLYSVLLVGLCWLCASFCETGWRCILDVWYLTVTENNGIITGYVAQAFEELYYGKSPKTGWWTRAWAQSYHWLGPCI